MRDRRTTRGWATDSAGQATTTRKRKQESDAVLGSMLTVRISPALLTRIDALVPKIAADADELPMMPGRHLPAGTDRRAEGVGAALR